jgi:hypothetical protein
MRNFYTATDESIISFTLPVPLYLDKIRLVLLWKEAGVFIFWLFYQLVVFVVELWRYFRLFFRIIGKADFHRGPHGGKVIYWSGGLGERK